MSKNKNNYFSSKSDVLKFLKPELKKSTIEKIYSFTIHDWKKDSKKILNLLRIFPMHSRLFISKNIFHLFPTIDF